MEQNQNKEFYPDFFITPRVIWLDKELPPMAEKVFSVIYWYGKLKDGYCHASNTTIAKNIGATNAKSVGNAISKLIERGYVAADYEPQTGERVALIPLIEYGMTPSLFNGTPPSNDGTPLHQMMEHNKNNIEKKYIVDFSKPIQEMKNEHRLYVGWLIEMVVGARKWLATPEGLRLSVLEGAAKKVKLTPKRYQKLSARVSSIGFETCQKAIRNCGSDEFYTGNNERGWKATIEWLFKDDEKVEELANRKVRK